MVIDNTEYLNMEIIDIREDHGLIDVLSEHHQKEWGHLCPGETLEGRKNRMRIFLGDGFIPTMYVAKKNGNCFGTVAIVENDMDTKPELTPWMAFVYVFPEHRRKGIGGMLVKYIMDKTRENGIKKMYLFTETQEKLYSRFGWETTSREKYHGFDIVIMETEL